MKAALVRSSFLDFFAERRHERVRSSALVPEHDPNLLFTNAGMNQFVDVFVGRETRNYQRACSVQKCVRAGGKHNDLDEVGKTPRHQTFFEMLGNFSFGDYFKQDAIAWAWELLTGVWGIDRERLVVSVFEGDEALGVGADDEARTLWREVAGLPDDRVIPLGVKENFWMMGETGPMGPCSEIHCYIGDGDPTPPPSDPDDPAWSHWLEIWNLVFMQYERSQAGGPLAPLPAPSIDTGAGLERVTSVLQGVRSNYDTDLFQPLVQTAAALAGKTYGAHDDDDVSMRVIADHARASAMLIADGVFPDKTDREYVLRRIFRRAVRHGKLLGIEQPFMHRMCETVVEQLGGAYPELTERSSVIREVALEEEKSFRATLGRGLSMLEDEFERLRQAGETELSGEVVFTLYDTHGFPADLTEIIAGEAALSIDHAGFERALESARARSRQAGGGAVAAGAAEATLARLADELPATEFLGYQGRGVLGEGQVLALVVDGEAVEVAPAGTDALVIADQTPFYAESGGQIGDLGAARTADGTIARLDDTRKVGALHVHVGAVTEGTLRVGDTVVLEVDDDRRERIRANHSATHLLHLALKRVLGDHVAQKGSLVAPDRLRFDFSHFSAITDEQIGQLEDMVNAEVWRNSDSITEVLPFDEAKQRGAVAMFGEKYGDEVRVVQIGGESLEFCGGTHVRRSGDIGLFKIVGEESVAQGVRRLEAVTGIGALAYLRELEGELRDAGARLKVAPRDVAERVGKMQSQVRELEREVSALKGKLAAGGARDLMSEVRDAGGVKVLATATEVTDAKTLRDTGDKLRDRLGSGVVLLAGVTGDKVSLLAMVTKDLTSRVHAGKLLKAVAQELGGRGGGRPDMAQGGGGDPDKVPAGLERALSVVAEMAASGQ